MIKRNRVDFTRGGANVFEDLGFPPAEARNLKIRAELMIALSDCISKKGLTQAEAARMLNVSQPRISDLMRGRLRRFSLDTLVNLLAAAGMEVAFHVKRPGKRAA